MLCSRSTLLGAQRAQTRAVTRPLSRQPRLQVLASRSGFPERPLHTFEDPYHLLGVQPGAEEKEIKRAYRKLAKQFHPDVSKEEQAEMRFVAISEAYSFLLDVLNGSAYGGDSSKPGNSQAFHDWYWSFRMSRTWERQQGGAPGGPGAAAAAQPQTQEQLRSQLAGLRHRAAIRRTTAARTTADSASAASSMEECEPDSEQAPEPAQPQASAAQATDAEDAAFAAAEGPSDSAEPGVRAVAGSSGGGARRRFVANSEVREGLKEQLHGMRRKAILKQQYSGVRESPYV